MASLASQLAWANHVCLPRIISIVRLPRPPGIYVDAGDLNYGSYACVCGKIFNHQPISSAPIDCMAQEGILLAPVAGTLEVGYVLLFHSWPYPVKNHLVHNNHSAATEIMVQDTE